MSTSDSTPDALLLIRASIAANTLPIPTSTDDPSSAADVQQDLTQATHLQFNHTGPHQHCTLPFTTQTRFVSSSGDAIDLRSIYFAWISKDLAVPDYINATQSLNASLANGAGGVVKNLVFSEKLDLITWLEAASDESAHIKPLDAEQAAANADAAAAVASGADGSIAQANAGQQARQTKTIDPRLTEILNGERRLGDRNTVLRGIKPTDFSHIRKHAEAFIGKHRARPGQAQASGRPSAPSIPLNPTLVQNRGKPAPRPNPIILLSPSASSLLRMSNIKSFLDDGLYTPPDSTSSSSNLLHVMRTLPSIDAQRPTRFILVDSPDMFKPDYWARVVAVFTTGQTWQFKSYKWQQPPDLFSHALGIFVGWRGEDAPATVKGWGRGVIPTQIDKYNVHQGPTARWRDREVVEGIWRAIEESMRSKGWNKETALAGK